jgi:hypothetical protein
MTAQARLPLANGKPLGASGPSLGCRLNVLRTHLATWVETCADYGHAAALYDELSRLSDAELRRRGLNRATLAWNLSHACDRSSG